MTPEGFSTDRTVYYDGTPGTGPDPLPFPPNPEDDSFKVSCVQPEGADVTYELANPRTTPHIGFSVDVGVAGQLCEVFALAISVPATDRHRRHACHARSLW